MSWEELNKVLIVATIVVLIARILVVAGYGRGTSKLLTFYLPTGALLVFTVRIFIYRTVDGGFSPYDLPSSLTWGLVVLTQAAATVHAWLPPVMWPRTEEVAVHDAKVLAKLDHMDLRITATGDAVDGMDLRITATGDAVDEINERQDNGWVNKSG